MKAVYIIDDNPEVTRQIAAVFYDIKDIVVEQFMFPWQLILRLEEQEMIYLPAEAVVITNLYSPSYWYLSPKKPFYQNGRSAPSPSDNPNFMKEIALDYIFNYLQVIVDKYGIRMIVYSYVFKFLEEKTKATKLTKELEDALENIGVSKDNIVKKNHEASIEEIKQIKFNALRVRGGAS